jgi:ribose/xylose/arabinose/galactoside ABC-type transport system permease subunit
MNVQRLLIALGLLILMAGIAWPILSRSGLRRLPGDVVIHRGNTSFYFPLVTCLLVSIALSVLFWLFNR